MLGGSHEMSMPWTDVIRHFAKALSRFGAPNNRMEVIFSHRFPLNSMGGLDMGPEGTFILSLLDIGR